MANKEDKGKVRVIYFELEGTNESLLESIRSITGTIKAGIVPQSRVVKILPSPKGDGDVQIVEEPEEEEDVIDAVENDDPPAANQSKPKKPRKVVTPKIVDIDLNSGPKPLRDFCSEKSPVKHNDKFVVIGAWLQEYQEQKEWGADLVFTCYRHMGWDNPADYGMILRNIERSPRRLVNKGSTEGMYLVNHIGVDYVKNLKKPE